MILGLCVALVALLVDQISKWYVQGYFENVHSPQAFGSFFNLVEAWNTGVSFSMFNNGGMLGIIILSAFALGVVIFLLFCQFDLHRINPFLIILFVNLLNTLSKIYRSHQ